MNARLFVAAALALALSACAGTPAKVEDPHHYSKDRDGNRVACYTTEIANEYECEPVARRHAHSHYHDPYWDPWWSYGFGWYGGYPWHHARVIYYPYPVHQSPRSSRRPRR